MTITRRQFSSGAGALLGSATLPSLALGQFAGDAEKALHEAAKKEGELTWYTAHYAVEQAEEYGREFTAKYPGVKCNVIRTTAHVAYQRLAQELKAGGPQVDRSADAALEIGSLRGLQHVRARDHLGRQHVERELAPDVVGGEDAAIQRDDREVLAETTDRDELTFAAGCS